MADCRSALGRSQRKRRRWLDDYDWGMSDESIAARIEVLVTEEHELRSREQSDSADVELLEADQQRLRAVEIELDRCWDLLRQRRALRDAGNDPDEAHVRDADTVERYLQ
jgi:Protein of unknown function (DUF2630)